VTANSDRMELINELHAIWQIMKNFLLTCLPHMLFCHQQNRQAYTLWGKLKLGGFLFLPCSWSSFSLMISRTVSANIMPTISAKPTPFEVCSNRWVTFFWRQA